MAVGDVGPGAGRILEPLGDLGGGAFATIAGYAWILIPLVLVLALGGGAWIYKTYKKKNSQWTHELIVKRVGQNNLMMSGFSTHKMRRFPLIKKAEVFELETPLLGGYLFPELDQYSGQNQYSIILDKNNRIYTNKGEFFQKDKSSINVSAKHSEIDISRSNLKSDFQNINQVSKRVEWATVAKYLAFTLFFILAFILGLKGISAWGEAQADQANQAQAEAVAFQHLASAIETMEAVVNTQKLEILPLMEEIYKTNNLQAIINKPIIINNGTI